MASQRSSQPIHVALVWVCHRCCVDLLLTSSAVSVCLYMWLYSVYFIFCTIVNPTVPVAWLFFGYTVWPVHDGVCVCVCARVPIKLFFTQRWFMVWACLGAIVCAYTQFSWTLWQLWQNTYTSAEWKRQRFTVLNVFFVFVFFCLFF